MQQARNSVDLAHKLKVLGVYKHLYKYLKLGRQAEESSSNQSRSDHVYVEQLRNEFRQNSVSDAKYCMQKDEMFFLAASYATYLDATHKTLDLYGRYCRGERSIEEAANIVGLRLPKTYEGASSSSSPSVRD